MSPLQMNITSLPTRYEPLVSTFGEKAKSTFVPSNEDLKIAKMILAAAESGRQGKLLLVQAPSGAGKSTFIHSLEVFLPNKVSSVVRLPKPHELSVAQVVAHLASLDVQKRITIVNFDGREAPYFSEPEYQTFLGDLNGLLRTRSDLVIVWPVTDSVFVAKIVA